MEGTEAIFSNTKTMVGLNKDSKTPLRFSNFRGKHRLRRANVGI